MADSQVEALSRQIPAAHESSCIGSIRPMEGVRQSSSLPAASTSGREISCGHPIPSKRTQERAARS
eukprot:COSAG02_NODE_43675_length_372_cov_1.688645_1_plen_65_part_10